MGNVGLVSMVWFVVFKGMCAKESKPLTSFQPASLHLVWDPIFGFKCRMYDALFSLPILATHA